MTVSLPWSALAALQSTHPDPRAARAHFALRELLPEPMEKKWEDKVRRGDCGRQRSDHQQSIASSLLALQLSRFVMLLHFVPLQQEISWLHTAWFHLISILPQKLFHQPDISTLPVKRGYTPGSFGSGFGVSKSSILIGEGWHALFLLLHATQNLHENCRKLCR